MTKEQKLEACSMRFDGVSLQEIADHFGVSEKYISRIVPICNHVSRRRSNPIIYKNIERYLEENAIPIELFASISGTSRQAMSAILSGKNSPSKRTVDKILEATGMTYEEAFYIPGENSDQPLQEETT